MRDTPWSFHFLSLDFRPRYFLVCSFSSPILRFLSIGLIMFENNPARWHCFWILLSEIFSNTEITREKREGEREEDGLV